MDNIIFISILSGKLPAAQQPRARQVGLLGAMLTRVALLFSLAWIIQLTQPWFSIIGHEISGRDLILILGGLFLLGKSTHEIHDRLATAIPEQQGTAIVHGDYRLDNCMVGDDGRIVAVLDWEICTLGDPLADVGLLYVYWTEAGDSSAALLTAQAGT